MLVLLSVLVEKKKKEKKRKEKSRRLVCGARRRVRNYRVEKRREGKKVEQS